MTQVSPQQQISQMLSAYWISQSIYVAAKLLDLTMMVIPGGMERTAAEFHDLFSNAGLELVAIIPTALDVCIIEGRPSA